MHCSHGPNVVQQPDLCQTLSLRLLSTMSLFSLKCTVPIGPNGENSQTMPNAFSPAPEHDEPILTEMHCSHWPQWGRTARPMPNAFSAAPEHDEPILTEMHCSHWPQCGATARPMSNAFSAAPEHDEPILTEMNCSHWPQWGKQPDTAKRFLSGS